MRSLLGPSPINSRRLTSGCISIDTCRAWDADQMHWVIRKPWGRWCRAPRGCITSTSSQHCRRPSVRVCHPDRLPSIRPLLGATAPCCSSGSRQLGILIGPSSHDLMPRVTDATPSPPLLSRFFYPLPNSRAAEGLGLTNQERQVSQHAATFVP
jgi:hypothetical protein